MIAAALLLLQAGNVAPPAVAPVPAPVPTDASILPPLPLLPAWRSDEELGHFVRDEGLAGRCAAVRSGADGGLDIDIAVLVAPGGAARRVVPAAIGCPAVEQYAAGIASRLVRGGARPTISEGWYRIAMTFHWSA